MSIINLTNQEINGTIIKDDATYRVIDNKTLSDLTLSQTILHGNCSTRGHSHDNQEEVYLFASGSGTMVVGTETFSVGQNSIVLIPSGEFHQVINTSAIDLVFNCVFNGSRNH